MKISPLKMMLILLCILPLTGITAETERTFTNADGKSLVGIPKSYDPQTEVVLMNINGRQEKIALSSFSAADQLYLKSWNMQKGFESPIKFKVDLTRKKWSTIRWSSTIEPLIMEPIKLPGKRTPLHYRTAVQSYEEITALQLTAQGYEILIKNNNMFPIDQVTIEHKIYYQQEIYITPEDIIQTEDDQYDEIITTNRIKYAIELLPSIAPFEQITLYSRCASIVDSQVTRAKISNSQAEAPNDGPTIEGFGEWGDSHRDRKGKLLGIWVRISIKDADGNTNYRDITLPDTLSKHVAWEGFIGDGEILMPELDETTSSTNSPSPEDASN
jgi:hypothetical protein